MKPAGGAVITSQPYKTSAVRDLAWACFSPPLIRCDQLATTGDAVANCPLALTPLRRDWLARLDREPSPLLRYLETQSSHKLGIYFERLWHFFLREDPAVELIGFNLPVREAGQTLGEFDVLYFCASRQCHVHLELAVKFYLGFPTSPAATVSSLWRQWLGPNSKDRLDLKLNHMLDRQIRLSEQPAARALLVDKGITELRREVEMKGYLFQPMTHALPAPFAYNSARPMCSWLTLGDLLREHEGLLRDCTFQLLHRLKWLAPAVSDERQAGLSQAELIELLQQHFATRSDAQLIAHLDATGQETGRIFVTPDRWPLHSER